MAKKFNFNDMSNAPVAQSADDVMTRAFEVAQEQQPEQGRVVPQPQDPTTPKQQELVPNTSPIGATHNEPSLFASLTPQWQQYTATHMGERLNGANVQMPIGLDNRINAIKNYIRTRPELGKFNKRELILLMLEWGCSRLEQEMGQGKQF